MALARAIRGPVLRRSAPAGAAAVRPLALAPLGRPRIIRQRDERGRRQRELARAAAGGGGGAPRSARGRAGRVRRGPPRAAQAHAAHAAVALRARGRGQEVPPSLAGRAALRRAVRLRAQAPARRGPIRRGERSPGSRGRGRAACLQAQTASDRGRAPKGSSQPATVLRAGAPATSSSPPDAPEHRRQLQPLYPIPYIYPISNPTPQKNPPHRGRAAPGPVSIASARPRARGHARGVHAVVRRDIGAVQSLGPRHDHAPHACLVRLHASE